MQIPKRMSSPADPSKPSFLDRPAEIRNAIYEFLFKREDPVLLHNAKAYHIVPPHDRYKEYHDYYLGELEDFGDEYEREIGQDQFFIHNFQLVTPFLLSCGQVYSEGVGYLYGGNEFIFSRPLYRHDGRGHRDGRGVASKGHDREAYLPLVYAAQWLSGIGSQLKFLTKVSIDVNALCPELCGLELMQMNMLLLLRMLWKHPNFTDILTLLARQPSEEETAHANEIAHTPGEGSADRVNKFSKILSALGTQDVLQLKRYCLNDVLVKNVTVWPSLRGGHMFLQNDNGVCIKLFDISADAVLSWRQERPARPNKLNSYGLMNNSRRTIISMAMYISDEIIFDLDTRTVHGLNLNYTSVAPWMRTHQRDGTPAVPQSTTVTIKHTTNEITTSFDNSKALEDMLYCPPRPIGADYGTGNVFRNILYRGLRNHPSTTIALNFSIETTTSLSELRINIKNIVFLLTEFAIPYQAKICLALNCPWGDNTHTEQATVTVADLQKGLFLRLNDFVEQWPADLPKARADSLPDLWINGNGVFTSASYPASPTTAILIPSTVILTILFSS
jgi:hypothetical protein